MSQNVGLIYSASGLTNNTILIANSTMKYGTIQMDLTLMGRFRMLTN